MVFTYVLIVHDQIVDARPADHYDSGGHRRRPVADHAWLWHRFGGDAADRRTHGGGDDQRDRVDAGGVAGGLPTLAQVSVEPAGQGMSVVGTDKLTKDIGPERHKEHGYSAENDCEIP